MVPTEIEEVLDIVRMVMGLFECRVHVCCVETERERWDKCQRFEENSSIRSHRRRGHYSLINVPEPSLFHRSILGPFRTTSLSTELYPPSYIPNVFQRPCSIPSTLKTIDEYRYPDSPLPQEFSWPISYVDDSSLPLHVNVSTDVVIEG